MVDIFDIQDEIARAISSALQVRLAPETGTQPRREPDLRAYEAYLRYQQHQWGWTPHSLRLSRECLEQAIALDPEFPLPYVGLADNHLVSAVVAMPSSEAMPRARDLAQRALALDADLPEAHATLGIINGFFDLDCQEAARRLALARQRDPPPTKHEPQVLRVGLRRSHETRGDFTRVVRLIDDGGIRHRRARTRALPSPARRSPSGRSRGRSDFRAPFVVAWS